MSGIKIELKRSVTRGCGGGKDFDNKVRCALDVFRGDDALSSIGNEQQVRLHHVGVREYYIEGGTIDFS